jgi:hypothetical protein
MLLPYQFQVCRHLGQQGVGKILQLSYPPDPPFPKIQFAVHRGFGQQAGAYVTGGFSSETASELPLLPMRSDHFERFERVYEERFEHCYGFFWPYVRQVIYRYLDCGDLHNSFTRVRCGDCGH